MNEQNLIFVVVDDAGKFGAAANNIACRELALEDGVLKMVAEAAHGFEDLAKALVVGDVIADEVRLPHFSYFSEKRGGIFASGPTLLVEAAPIPLSQQRALWNIAVHLKSLLR
jgi:hypothetical protein